MGKDVVFVFVILGSIAVIVSLGLLYSYYRVAADLVVKFDKDWKKAINKPVYMPGITIWLVYSCVFWFWFKGSGMLEFLSAMTIFVLMVAWIWIPVYKITKKILMEKLERVYCDRFLDYRKIKENYRLFQEEIKRIFKSMDVQVRIDSFHGKLEFSYYWTCSSFCDADYSIKVDSEFRKLKSMYKPVIPLEIEHRYEDFGGDMAQLTYYDIVFSTPIPLPCAVRLEKIKEVLKNRCGIVERFTRE